MQLGIALRLLTVLAAFVLGKIAFDTPSFDEKLSTLPAELVFDRFCPFHRSKAVYGLCRLFYPVGRK